MLQWKIGDVRIRSLLEFEWPIPASGLVPDATPERLAPYAFWLRPDFVDDRGRLRIAIQALLVESRGLRILIDTCVGNDKPRTIRAFDRLKTPFLEELERAGFARDSVDVVVCTHLHVDHVGWNTLRVGDTWLPTFSRARHLIARAEWAHWSRADREDEQDDEAIGDSVQPIFAAGLVDLVEPDHAITDEVRLEPTPGHTPGHVAVRIRSGGDEAVITGDLVHHPSQCAHPEWGCIADVEPGQADDTRRRFFDDCAERGVLMIGTHFAAPTAGHVVTEGGARRFRALRHEGGLSVPGASGRTGAAG